MTCIRARSILPKIPIGIFDNFGGNGTLISVIIELLRKENNLAKYSQIFETFFPKKKNSVSFGFLASVKWFAVQ